MGKHHHHGEIWVHTDKGEYTSGETIYGTVFVNAYKPLAAEGLHLELKGYEKVFWVDHETEFYKEGEQTKTRTIEHKREAEHHFFKDHFDLIQYSGNFPPGKFSYPFRYQLPEKLPGVFELKRHELKVKIAYKIKAILPLHHEKPLKDKQHVYIYERLNKDIQPKHVNKSITVMTCCCFPRGPVHCEAWVDKNAYRVGETAQVHVVVNNESSVNVDHFNTKLQWRLHLKDHHGHSKVLNETVCQAKYEGTPSGTKKATDIPLLLMNNKKPIQPSTASKYIDCSYSVHIECDVPWAPDLVISNPITIYTGANEAWQHWQQPSWIAEAQMGQGINPQLQVPQDVLSQRMNNNGVFEAPQGYVPPPLPSAPMSDFPPNALPPTYQGENSPLLGN